MREGPLRILFVDAIDPENSLQRSFRPLGIGYLAAVLRNKLGDGTVRFRLAIDDVEAAIKEFSPQVVAISSTSQNFDIARQHAVAAKEAGAMVLIGGYHISMMRECLPPEMDIGIIGEGEETFAELMSVYRVRGQLKNVELLKSISGVVFHAGKDLVMTRPRKSIRPLDKLPSPDRDLLGMKETAIMLTSRGCPYRCLFCASTRFWGGIRFFSAAYILREVRDLVERYKVNHIVLFDDLFIVNKERVQQLARLIRAEKLHKRVIFNCLAAASLVDDEVAKLLRSMNVCRVGMGLESGSERILKYLKGEYASVEANRNAVEILARHGIETEGSFIIGAPDETEEDMLETLDFVKRSRLDRFDVHLLTPYPGTPLWDYARERGLVSPEMPWERLYRDFSKYPDEAIFLCEKTSCERAHSIFVELMAERDTRERKLRRKTAIKTALRHPARIPSLLNRAAKSLVRRQE